MSILAWIEDQRKLKLLNATKYNHPASDGSQGLWTRCDHCGVILYIKHLKENQRVCFGCGFHLQMNSLERIEHLIDLGTWRPLDETVSPCDPLEFKDQKQYTERLKDAQEKTGLQDAIQTGTGMLDGIPVAVGIMDFHFMGGSMGSVVGEKITRLIEYATQEGLTLILVCASGGARMQEGILSLMQMAKISAALQVYQSCANLLYISVLTSPTTGGVTASFAMLGDLIFAEPKALIGFAGRRVIEQTLQEQLPDDFQTAEYLLHHGLLDLIVPRSFLKQALSETITLYKDAPFQQAGVIPHGIQHSFYFATEEKVRRKWNQFTSKLGTDNEFGKIEDFERYEVPTSPSRQFSELDQLSLVTNFPTKAPNLSSFAGQNLTISPFADGKQGSSYKSEDFKVKHPVRNKDISGSSKIIDFPQTSSKIEDFGTQENYKNVISKIEDFKGTEEINIYGENLKLKNLPSNKIHSNTLQFQYQQELSAGWSKKGGKIDDFKNSFDQDQKKINRSGNLSYREILVSFETLFENLSEKNNVKWSDKDKSFYSPQNKVETEFQSLNERDITTSNKKQKISVSKQNFIPSVKGQAILWKKYSSNLNSCLNSNLDIKNVNSNPLGNKMLTPVKIEDFEVESEINSREKNINTKSTYKNLASIVKGSSEKNNILFQESIFQAHQQIIAWRVFYSNQKIHPNFAI